MDTERAMLARQMDLVPLKILPTPVTVIGAGAVGSFATLCLAKMGLDNITVFDDDTVSDVNIGNQFYPLSAVGSAKVSVLASLIEAFSGTVIKTKEKRFAPTEPTGRVVIAAVDSMESRKEIWKAIRGRPGTTWLVDPRMGGEHASVRVVRSALPSDWDRYEKTLWDDSETAPEPCTSKATAFTAAMLGGLVAQTVRDCLLEKNKREITWSIKDYVLETE